MTAPPALEAPASPGDLRRATLFLVALWALLFAPQIFAGRAFVLGDAGSIRAFAEFSAARWRDHHERTHWNPYVFGGLPATVSLQDSRPQWLPDPLLDAFDAVHRLPGFPPLAIPLLLHLGGMIAIAELARRLWRAGTLAMTWSGTAWGLLPAQLVPFAFGQDWLLAAISLLPVVLLAVERVADTADGRARFGATLGLALAVGALFLAAHPQILALGLPLTVVFAIERARPGRKVATLGGVLAGLTCGLAMATVVWWPAHLYNAHSVRSAAAGGVSLSEVNAWSAGLGDLAALAWPWAAGFGGATYWGGLQGTDFPQFTGTAVCVLGGIGLLRGTGSLRTVTLLAAAAVAATLLALGTHLGPPYRWMYEHVPLWSTFRVAVRNLIVVHLALVLLSARGLDAALRAPAAVRRRWAVRAAWACGALLLAAAGLRFGLFTGLYGDAVEAARPRIDPAAAIAVAEHAAIDLGGRALLLGALVAALASTGRRMARVRIAIVLGLLVVDLGVPAVPFLARSSGRLAELEHPPPPLIAQCAGADHDARVLDLTRRRRFSNDWIRWRVRSFTGNHPAVPREWGEMWNASIESYGALCALSVRWIGGLSDVADDTTHFRRVAGSPDSAMVWEVREALPRASAVASIRRLASDRHVLAALASSEFDPRATAFTVDDGIAGDYPGSADARLHWTVDDPDHLEIVSVATAPAFLVISDPWFPGWRATLDGRPLAIHRVHHMLRGMPVPAGTHRLRLDYEPEGWAVSLRVTWAAWLAWLLAVAVRLAFMRRNASRTEPAFTAAT